MSDLEESTVFYRDVVGLTFLRGIDREGAPISQVVGYEDVKLRTSIFGSGIRSFIGVYKVC